MDEEEARDSQASVGSLFLEAIRITSVVLYSAVWLGWKNLRCKCGLHGKTLTRISSNAFHVDYRCSHCRAEKIVFR